MSRTQLVQVLVGLTLLSAPAAAQSFNVDIGDTFTFGHPAPTYGGAAGQPGFWNPVSGGYPYNFVISDLSGTMTAATIMAANNGTGTGDFFFDNANTTGDDQMLMDDFEDVGGGTSATTWTFTGLLDGSYDVYTYAWGSDSPTYVSNVTPGGSTDTQTVGGAWPGGHAMGNTYALHCVTVSGGQMTIEVMTGTGFASVNGFQVRMKTAACPPPPPTEPGTPFCDCTTAGPCGNTGAADHGCGNGANPSGPHLDGTGMADTAADDVVLQTVGAAPNQPGLYFQGDNAINGGAGVLFGDGLRCAGMNVIRLQTLTADANGDSSTTVTVSVKGLVNPGDTKHYQLWYRDPQGSPCGALFNLSNGYTITWL